MHPENSSNKKPTVKEKTGNGTNKTTKKFPI